MGRYVARRLLQFIPTLIFTLLLLHYLMTLSLQISGNPVASLFGDRRPPQEIIDTISAQFGLNDACLDQTGNPCLGIFWDRVTGYATGDLGFSFTGRAVTDLLSERLPLTLRLALIAIAFQIVVGIVIGVIAGIRKDKLVDNAVRMSTVLLIAVPVFVFGVLVSLLVGIYVGNWVRGEWDWAPEWVREGLFAPIYRAEHMWASLIVPGFVLGAFSLAAVARLTRSSLIENLRADYVRTARAKGLTSRRVVGVHTLRNSLIPVVTYVGVSFGGLMGGAVVTEGIFSIPGVGNLVFVAVRTGEAPIVIVVVTLLVLVFLIVNLIVDIFYAVLDPRIRYD
jgi:peptide/nickel transport system permease protein/oligopeptide transport system permease protein